MAVVYRYELRAGADLLATGRLSRDQPLQSGDRIEVAGRSGTIRLIEPALGTAELRLVVELASSTGR